MNIKRLVGQVIKDARIKKGISLEDIAKRFNSGITSIQSWQRGDVLPPAENFLKLAAYLDIDVNEIIKVMKVLEGDSK